MERLSELTFYLSIVLTFEYQFLYTSSLLSSKVQHVNIRQTTVYYGFMTIQCYVDNIVNK